MNKNKVIYLVVGLLLLALLCVGILNIYLTLEQAKNSSRDINNAVRLEVSRIEIPVPKDGADGVNGHTPVKNVDYFDGLNATDEQVQTAVNNYFKLNPVATVKGDAGVEGKSIVGETGLQGPPGITPQIRCNVIKNRWEVRFNEADNWQLMNNEKVKCTTGE